MRRILRVLVLSFLAAVWMVAQASHGLGYGYFDPLPMGTVRVTRPEIGVRIQPAAGDGDISVRLYLDGVPVPVQAGADGWYGYRPTADLAAGAHQVVARIVANGYADLKLSSDFEVASDAVRVLPAQSPEAWMAQRLINRMRQGLGLGPLTYDAALGLAAQMHAGYDVAHPTEPDPHGERPDLSGFVAVDPLARGQAFGYAGEGADEVIDFKLRAEENVADWLATLYHRIPLIAPGSQRLGYGLAFGQDAKPVGVADLGIRTAVSPVAVRFPADGARDVPTGWAGREHPDPLRLYPGADSPLGYTVSLTFGPSPRQLTLHNYSLRTRAGTPVAVYSYAPDQDDELRDTVALIPTRPLQPGTTYQVSMVGTVDQGSGPQPYQYAWSFTTLPEPWLDLAGSSRYATGAGGKLTEVELHGQGFAQTTQIYLQGLRMLDATVDSPTHLSFRVPQAFAGGAADLVLATPRGQEVTIARFFDGSEGLPPSGGVATMQRPLQGGAGVSSTLQGADGGILLPASMLRAMGWDLQTDEHTGRLLATAASHDLTAVPGRPVAMVDGVPLLLGATPRLAGGSLFVPSPFIKAAADLQQLPLEISVGGGRVTVTVAGFTDILGHWAEPGIIRLVTAGVINGYGDQTFRPQSPLTRAAFLKLVAAAAHLPRDTHEVAWIADCDGHWLQNQGYLAALVRAGVLTSQDVERGLLHPDDPIDRQTMSVWAVRALGQQQMASPEEAAVEVRDRFVDGDAVAGQDAPYVLLAARIGLITGYAVPGGHAFRPTNGASRAEAVTVIDRLIQHLGS